MNKLLFVQGNAKDKEIGDYRLRSADSKTTVSHVQVSIAEVTKGVRFPLCLKGLISPGISGVRPLSLQGRDCSVSCNSWLLWMRSVLKRCAFRCAPQPKLSPLCRPQSLAHVSPSSWFLNPAAVGMGVRKIKKKRLVTIRQDSNSCLCILEGP